MTNQALMDEDIQLLNDSFPSKDDFERLEKKVDVLPSKQLFLSEMAKLMRELKDYREEVAVV